MLLERERNYGLGMDALVIVCSWNANGIMVWAWMLWSSYALGTRMELWFGHGCSGHRMLCKRLHMVATRFPCAPTLEPHQLQRNLVGTTERRVHEAASHLKRAYENPEGIYQNGSILYIAGTEDPIDFYDDLKFPFYQTRNTKRYKDVDKFSKDGAIEIDGKKHYGISDIVSHSLGSPVGQQRNK